MLKQILPYESKKIAIKFRYSEKAKKLKKKFLNFVHMVIMKPNSDCLLANIYITLFFDDFFALLKFRYSEKATKIKKISNFVLTLLSNKKKVYIFSNSVAFSKYLNFMRAKKIVKEQSHVNLSQQAISIGFHNDHMHKIQRLHFASYLINIGSDSLFISLSGFDIKISKNNNSRNN
jgi:hypothetical protein